MFDSFKVIFVIDSSYKLKLFKIIKIYNVFYPKRESLYIIFSNDFGQNLIKISATRSATTTRDLRLKRTLDFFYLYYKRFQKLFDDIITLNYRRC